MAQSHASNNIIQARTIFLEKLSYPFKAKSSLLIVKDLKFPGLFRQYVQLFSNTLVRSLMTMLKHLLAPKLKVKP